jgi:polyhydroxyalkanoate synthesis regulator phasin
MAAPADEDGSGERSLVDLFERLALAGIGAVALTADRIDALADELAERGGLKRDEGRATINDLARRQRAARRARGRRSGRRLP